MSVKSLVPTVLLMIVVAAVGYIAGNKGLPKGLPDMGASVMGSSIVDEVQAGSDHPAAVGGDVKQNILNSIKALDETVTEIQLEETPIKGVYWVLLPGNETLLVSGDGRFVLGRSVSEFKDGKLEPVKSDVVELAKLGSQRDIVDAFQSTAENQIVYAAEGEKKSEIYVFTDVNCGYCRKFHKDIPELTKAGIEVRYFAGPFFSKDRASLESIWCSENPQMAMNKVKSGQKISGVDVTPECVETVSQHIAIGQKLGIRGTPALYTASGEQVGGYVPPKQLVATLTGS